MIEIWRVRGRRAGMSAIAGIFAAVISANAASTPQQRQAIKAALVEAADAPLKLQADPILVQSTPPNPSSTEHPQSQLFPAKGDLLGHPPVRKILKTADPQGADITLNFINADVKDVAKAVLGDYLKLNYEIAANVQGPVTIQTSRPLPRAQVLAILDQTLRLNGMAIVLHNDVYKVVTADDAARESLAVNPVASHHQHVAGFGVEVAPIKYISAAEMQKLLEPLAPSKAIVHIDSARNVLLIEGTEQERQTLLDDIALFDSDWLAGMSFALYTPTNVDAQELARELTEIMGGTNSPIASVVRMVPIDRLNAVLAISPQPRYLEQLRGWVARLDRPGQGTDRRIYVYSVQHGRATDLAATLSKALFGASSENVPTRSTYTPPPPTSATPAGSSGESTTKTAIENALPPQSASEPGPATSAGGLTGVRINADETNNALIILATPQQYAHIQQALQQLDLQPLEVLLEASIAEVTLGNKLQYGVQYFMQSGSNQLVLSNSDSAAIAPTFPGFSYLLSTSNIKIILDELSTITHVEVLSSPQLMVINNETASLEVGDQVPVIAQQAVNTQDPGAPLVNTVQYQNTGVILRVTPRVNRSGEVMMDVSQEVSDVVPTSSSHIDSPTIEERKIASAVVVQDGETIALGGLITKTKSHSRSGLPFISDVPVLGDLFSSTDDSESKTELMVIITPHVVDNMRKARAITDELRHKLPAVQALFNSGPA